MKMTREEYNKRYNELKAERTYWGEELLNARNVKYEDIALENFNRAVEEFREFKRTAEIEE